MSSQFRHCILGVSDRGELGLRYQMELLNRHDLQATFFVEPLHSAAVGDRWLSETVGMITDAGHDVQLHAHTEWLSDTTDADLPNDFRQFIRQYSLIDQTRILSWGRRCLERCGARPSVAFRAGSFGANADTLRALNQIGVQMDSSANRCHAGAACHIDALDQPASVEGVVEFPMTVFRDYPGHFRPAQLAACSAWELERALWQARAQGWSAFVVLWHGQELLQPRFDRDAAAAASVVAVRRFERLCRFLGDHRDEFQTTLFSAVDPLRFLAQPPALELSSNMFLTAHRMVEQAIGRFV